jgi:uncharacterized protein (TIGR00369 family)
VPGSARSGWLRSPAVAPTDPRIQVPPNSELTLGAVCIDKTQAGRSVWHMAADERFANPAGTIQGGFLSALADSAMGAATITWAAEQSASDGPASRGVYIANVEMKVSFLKAARVGSALTCTARVVGGGSRATFVEAEVVDHDGRAVARASSTYLLTPRA